MGIKPMLKKLSTQFTFILYNLLSARNCPVAMWRENHVALQETGGESSCRYKNEFENVTHNGRRKLKKTNSKNGDACVFSAAFMMMGKFLRTGGAGGMLLCRWGESKTIMAFSG